MSVDESKLRPELRWVLAQLRASRRWEPVSVATRWILEDLVTLGLAERHDTADGSYYKPTSFHLSGAAPSLPPRRSGGDRAK